MARPGSPEQGEPDCRSSNDEQPSSVEGLFNMDSPEPETASQPAMGHHDEVPPPGGTRGADEIDLELATDTSVFEDDRASLAEDWVLLRELQRDGGISKEHDAVLFGKLAGDEEMLRLIAEAASAGDHASAFELLVTRWSINPESLMSTFDLTAEDLQALELGDGEPDPPVSQPRWKSIPTPTGPAT